MNEGFDNWGIPSEFLPKKAVKPGLTLEDVERKDVAESNRLWESFEIIEVKLSKFESLIEQEVL